MIKIKRNSLSLRNSLTFITLSMIFLASIQSLIEGVSLFSTSGLLLVLKSNYLTILLALATLYTILKFYKISKNFILFFTIIVTMKSFYALSMSFNKLVLAFDFIYILYAFYFYTDWELFLDSAASTPNFSRFDLEKSSRFPISGVINYKELSLPFRLTNIDDKGCFVLFDSEDKLELNAQGIIKISYENIEFQSSVECVSLYDQGAGFIYQSKNNRRDLSGLYQVCLERGFFN